MSFGTSVQNGWTTRYNVKKGKEGRKRIKSRERKSTEQFVQSQSWDIDTSICLYTSKCVYIR